MNTKEELKAELFDVLNCYEIDASEISHGTTYIDSTEAKRIIDRIMPHILAKYFSKVEVFEVIKELNSGDWRKPINSDELRQILEARL